MGKWLRSSACAAAMLFSIASAFAESIALSPNDKLVAPKGCGPLGNISKTQPLIYTVRFQNTGTGPAHDVVLRDVLDNDLDITTLQILASSHHITHVEIIPDNALIISFEGIELPDSGSNPLGSNGFLNFSIKPKVNLPDGAQITNQAGIYFDFNEAVLTNSTLNTLRNNPEPIADFTSKHSCTNTGLVYDFIYTGATADNATFLWNFGTGATPQTSTQQNPSGIIFSSIDAKQVTLTVTRFGCTASITKTVDVIDVSCGNNKVVICHKPPGNPDNLQTICISKSSLQAHLNHGDCIGICNTSNAKEETADNIFDIADVLEINASPNPFHSSINITVKSQKEDVIELGLYNVFGQKIFTFFTHINAAQENVFEMNGNNLLSGIYILKIHSTTEGRYIKLIRAP